MVRRAGSRFGVPFALPPRRSPGFTPFGCAISWVSHCCYFWCFCSMACWVLPACFCSGYHVGEGGAGEHKEHSMILTVPWRRGDYLGSGRVQERDAAVSPVHGTKEGGGRSAKSGKRGCGGTP